MVVNLKRPILKEQAFKEIFAHFLDYKLRSFVAFLIMSNGISACLGVLV